MLTREERNKEIQDEIEEEKSHARRKKIIKCFIKFTIILIIFLIIFSLYTKHANIISLIVKEKRIVNEKIPESFNGKKIIHFSDLNYGNTFFEKELNNLVRKINSRKPDVVVFTGNLISNNYKLTIKEQERIIKILQKIDTSIGKYAVNGKNDKNKVFNIIMNQSNFTILNNNYDLIYNNTTTPILITGLSSYIKKERNIDEAFKYFKEETHNSNIYTICIMSETEDLDETITNYNPDLVLAGNSLNGEIRLPLIGGIISQSGSSKYVDSHYKVKTSEIYISGGLDSPTLGFRINNNPSINLFRITNKK